MNLSRLFLIISVSLFVGIGFLSYLKKRVPVQEQTTNVTEYENIELSQLAPLSPPPSVIPIPTQEAEVEKSVVIEHDEAPEGLAALFEKPSSSPLVQTIRYKSRVPWKPRRSAWLVDYARHYKTPVDFICKSLDRGVNPTSLSEGVQFNVFRLDFDFRFHLLVSLNSCRMRLYYVIPHEKKVVFLKSYPVCLGKKASSSVSGSLTPLGVFQLGSRVAVFKPNMMGMHKNKRVELVQVFGTHWIPFEREIAGCSEPARGFGIHGTPMLRNARGGLEEQLSSIGEFSSDGCIRLAGKDMQELFSVISTRKTYIEIVPSFQQSKLLNGELL